MRPWSERRPGVLFFLAAASLVVVVAALLVLLAWLTDGACFSGCG
jgi:hypothetical protein